MQLNRIVGVAVVFVAGAAMSWLLAKQGVQLPEKPALVERVREVARLETLEVRLYKRVSFSPDPTPAGSVWGDVLNWVRDSVMKKEGRALVFADVSLGLDLSKLKEGDFEVRGQRVRVSLPPLRAQVALRPEDTEFIDSNLDSAQTAKLFELAKDAFERQVEGDQALQHKARESAERSIRALLINTGFKEVVFVDARG